MTKSPERRLARGVGVAWIGAALGLLVVVLVQAIPSGRALANTGSVNLSPLLLALLPACAAPVAHAWRWAQMLATLGERLALGPALRATIVATLANYAVPGYAWAPVKGLVARRVYGIGLVRSAPTLVLEQGLDVVMLVAGTALGFLLMPGMAGQWRPWLPSHRPTIVLLAFAALLALMVVRHSERWRYALGMVRLNWQRLLGSRPLYPWLVGLTVLRWAADLASFWLVASALGLDLSLARLLVLVNLPAVAGVVAPVPGGLGVREGSVLAVGSALGLGGGSLALAALVHRIVLLAGLPLAFLLTLLLPRSRRCA